MSEAGNNLWVLAAGLSAINIAGAAITLRRPHATAKANRTFIESGEETHFEQRRAWAAYGSTPETDPERLKRNAWRLIALNLLAIAAFAALGWLS